MKKIITICTLLMIGLTMQSQVLITILLGDKLNSDGLEFGLEGGLNWTQISGMETKKFAHKWNLGFYFDFRLKNQWSLYTGVLVKSNMGVDKLTSNDLDFLQAKIYTDDIDGSQVPGEYSQKMNYFLVPALIKYKFKKHIYLEAGPQFGLMYKSWIEFNGDVDGSDAILKQYNKDMINRIDVGVMVGVGYTLIKGTGWTIGVKYYEGLVNVYKDRSGTKNRSIFLKLNIPIGAGDKSQLDTKEKKVQKNKNN